MRHFNISHYRRRRLAFNVPGYQLFRLTITEVDDPIEFGIEYAHVYGSLVRLQSVLLHEPFVGVLDTPVSERRENLRVAPLRQQTAAPRWRAIREFKGARSDLGTASEIRDWSLYSGLEGEGRQNVLW